MSSNDAVFSLPSVDDVRGARMFFYGLKVFRGRLDVAAYRDTMAAYFFPDDPRYGLTSTTTSATATSDEPTARRRPVDPEASEAFSKLLFYPVRKFGYLVWKRDREFQLDSHFVQLKK